MQPAPRNFSLARLALILTTAYIVLLGLVSAHPGSIHVRKGQSIQAAIRKASCGDRITVGKGTYAEQLTIEKDGISLIGLGAILVPPKHPVKNICSGLAGPDQTGSDSQAGICVEGSGIVLAKFVTEHRKVLSVKKPVKDVLVTGFEVNGFSGENIAVVGAKNARVKDNKLLNGGSYGALTVGSKNTWITGNTITSQGFLRFIGICMDDVAGVQVSNNRISGYFIGLCVQTPGAELSHNDVSNGCVGAFVDPGVKGAKLSENHFNGTDPTCPPQYANGIVLSGAVKTDVRHNTIKNQRDAGVAVVDDPSGAVSSGNVVTQNTLSHNGVDLFLNTTSTTNVFSHNKCSTSVPAGLCALK